MGAPSKGKTWFPFVSIRGSDPSCYKECTISFPCAQFGGFVRSDVFMLSYDSHTAAKAKLKLGLERKRGSASYWLPNANWDHIKSSQQFLTEMIENK